MKLPFSYRHHFFKASLVASLAAHTVAFGGWNFFAPVPKYAVEQSRTSLEVILTEEQKPQPVKERIIVTKDESEANKVHETRREKPDMSKPVLAPLDHGAIQKAKPGYLRNPAPPYPHMAREKGWEGTVILKVFVERDGQIGRA